MNKYVKTKKKKKKKTNENILLVYHIYYNAFYFQHEYIDNYIYFP